MNCTKPGDRMLAIQAMRDLTHAERTVLTCIAWHDGPGGARPSLERIAELAGMRRSTVVEHVKAIIAKGRITATRGRHTNTYTVWYGPAGHCQGFPDGDGQGHCQEIPALHCQEFPDGNRKEPGASNSGKRPPDSPAPAGSGEAADEPEGKATAAAKRKRCRSPELCTGIPDDGPRCRICGADQ